MKKYSLRIKLLTYLLPALGAATVLVGIFSALSIYHEVGEVYDATLVQFSKTLPHNGNSISPHKEGAAIAHKYERNISYRIFQHGNLVAQSNDAESFRGNEPTPGFSDQVVDGKKWRFFTFIDDNGDYTIEVAEKYSIRRELILQLLGSLVVPGIIFAFVALAIVWFGVTRSLHQLVNLSAQVDARQANDLIPITDPSVPVEISPLLDALNRLLKRMEESFLREREFTDNAAHELRTPLAAMKTQAQVLQKTETLSQAGKEGLENLLQAIDRSVEMMEGLLAFARLQSDTDKKQLVDLSDLVEREYITLQKSGVAKNLTMQVDIDPGITVEGTVGTLGILIRNIIQNAIKFTPSGGTVCVSLKKANDKNKAIFSVTDTGPGIPALHKGKVFERFYRINKSTHSGSGLGLAMVKWIAEAHAAKVELADNQPQGLIFSVCFIVEERSIKSIR